jgi:hypothetical protein
MKIRDAIDIGIRRIRKSHFAFPDSYILLPNKKEGKISPWAFLFSRTEQNILGVPTPQEIFLPYLDGFLDEECDIYDAKLDENDTQ